MIWISCCYILNVKWVKLKLNLYWAKEMDNICCILTGFMVLLKALFLKLTEHRSNVCLQTSSLCDLTSVPYQFFSIPCVSIKDRRFWKFSKVFTSYLLGVFYYCLGAAGKILGFWEGAIFFFYLWCLVFLWLTEFTYALLNLGFQESDLAWK